MTLENPDRMRRATRISKRKKRGEEGILLVMVMFLLFLMVLGLAVAMPKVRESIQRDRDRETMERGKQYMRAIQLYYRKFGSYPPSIDALVKTNEIRFLRKRYIDPTTGKDDWQPIRLGENKVPVVMGFFGQPLGQSTIGGVGPSGGNGISGATPIGGSPGGSTGGIGAGGIGAGGAGVSSGIGGTTTGIGGTPTGGTTGSSGSGDDFGSSGGQTFGGAGIIGVKPASAAKSILMFKGKDHYNEWEFTYDPLMDQKQVGGSGSIGQPANNSNNGDSFGTPGMTTGPTTGPASPSTPTTGIGPQ